MNYFLIFRKVFSDIITYPIRTIIPLSFPQFYISNLIICSWIQSSNPQLKSSIRSTPPIYSPKIIFIYIIN